MKNKNLVPEQLVKRFMMGKLSVSEEKILLDWIDQSPQHEDLFRKEQKRLSLIVSETQDTNVDEQWRQLSVKIQSKRTVRNDHLKHMLFRLRIPAAAALIIFALIGYLILDRDRAEQGSFTALTETISTPCGERTSFLLPDGTKVSLNSDSKLMFPKEFSENLRQVELSGEAFFEVTPNKEAPFIVHTAALDVRVLGTAFNVEAFPGTSHVNTTLVHGKVILEREVDHQTTTLAEMNPYDRVVFSVDNQEVRIQKQTNLEQYIGWKDGKLVFLNASITEVAKKLELWYNVSVQIQGEDLKKSHFTATFTNETIEQVLRLLSISYPFGYRIEQINEKQNGSLPKFEIILSSSNE
jgi:ferric-dicitrate binding protein FerR (iron transport regulator)